MEILVPQAFQTESVIRQRCEDINVVRVYHREETQLIIDLKQEHGHLEFVKFEDEVDEELLKSLDHSFVKAHSFFSKIQDNFGQVIEATQSDGSKT